MAWLKVDDRFFDSDVALGNPTAGLMYLQSLTYLMRFTLDYLPQVVVDRLYSNTYGAAATARAVDHLVTVGVWVPVEDGFAIVHRWVEDEVVIETDLTGNASVIAIARASASECAHCGSTERLEIDHIVPRSRGGDTRPNNLQVLCHACNMAKAARVPWGNFRRPRA